ncbi:hypothetical protein BG004_001154 [Podila humilis]|nr:hypothetical protein BG004_001154 [Podila humilis]
MVHHGVTLIPTLSVGVDLMGIGIIFISIIGLFGVVRGSKKLMNVYFVSVLCFNAFQVVHTIVGFTSGSKWTINALERSWEKAYNRDQSLIHDMQREFGCLGFYTHDDRSGGMEMGSGSIIPVCSEVLQARFGRKLERIGYLILCIRLIQLTGLFLLSILFKHLASMDSIEEQETEVEEEAESENEKGTREKSYFLSEKQLEEGGCRIPLLANSEDDDDDEEEDLPHYSVKDIYRHEDEESSDAEDDDGYRDLPEYYRG